VVEDLAQEVLTATQLLEQVLLQLVVAVVLVDIFSLLALKEVMVAQVVLVSSSSDGHKNNK